MQLNEKSTYNNQKDHSPSDIKRYKHWDIEEIIAEDTEGNNEYDSAWDVIPKHQIKVGTISKGLSSALGMQSNKDPPPYFSKLIKIGVPPLCM